MTADIRTAAGRPHHDGSELHLPEQNPSPGDVIPVFVRLPRTYLATSVHLRSVTDGESAYTPAVLDRRDAHDFWWRADLRIGNPVTNYRFLIDRGGMGRVWLHAAGIAEHDIPDATDFRVTTFSPPPDWIRTGLIYQIFPDRFARSARAPEQSPPWAVPAAWDDPVIGRGPDCPLQFYGGDLYGIAERLDYVQRLGADVLYLTPVFPAESNHRYNASSFHEVDPLLGGDRALGLLTAQAHRRGMRVIGDLTTNHSGDTHDWFRRAVADPTSEQAGYYYFRSHPEDYVSWLGVPTLPKFNWGSAALRTEMLAVVGKWLRPPYGLDGWRIDVANMSGRCGDDDYNQEIARMIRAHMPPDTFLLAEHFHDYTADMPGDGWHATMNYSGFARPVWSWLTRRRVGPVFPGMPLPLRQSTATEAVGTMRAFAAAVPWSVSSASVNLLGSHDTPRIRTILGSADHVAVAAGLLFTYPGTPMVFMGDELGLEGENGEHSRTPMPWGATGGPVYEVYRDLITLRRTQPALQGGGLRWLHTGGEALAYLRENAEDRLLILASRAAHEGVRLPGTLARFSPRNLYGGAAAKLLGDTLELPGDGPTFQVWSI
ncbi:glycoside hydrolase family 13 protein [Rhizohabitans arisaemae]|uniref:glycoside hydrolase family 13 protein n=1 Tax=Rhizohabitans arisaemae TaxID=2720610 RepID=UPI0024B220D8|nr:glycoside hydrolase family 13 protein [Rhizohabitans arisaemae]